jgi:poly(hydroxyalkanoate) depolymerase family esterase
MRPVLAVLLLTACAPIEPPVPEPDDPRPLVVALHGCNQSPAELLAISRLEELAAAEGFHLIAPEQPASANLQRCWNWFLSEHQARDRGEPARIMAAVDEARAALEVDDERIIAVGLSAGAAMANILGVVYPDVFSGLGVVAGLEWRAATNVSDAFTAMSSGGPDPAAQGRDAASVMGESARPPRVVVVHGDSDQTVAPVNGEQVVAQWAKVHDLLDGDEDESVDAVADAESEVEGAPVFDHHDASGDTVIQHVVVPGMDHAWPGGAQGAFSAPDEIDATRAILDLLL